MVSPLADHRGRRPGYRGLDLCPVALPLENAAMKGRKGASVGAHDQPLLGETGQVISYRDLGHLQPLADIRNAQGAVFREKIDDFLFSFRQVLFHRAFAFKTLSFLL